MIRPATILLVLSALLWAAGVHAQDKWVVSDIRIEGNKKTKEDIILRELNFSTGDTVYGNEFSAMVERSRQNIFNTALFNKVTSKITYQTNGFVDVEFTVEERWYIWPYPILENADRNFSNWLRTTDFNRLSYGIHLNWYNFRGRDETLQFLGKLGFEQEFAVGYDIVNINKTKTLGLYVAAGYSNNKEVNYASEDNRRVFYKDESRNGKEEMYALAALSYRKGLYVKQTLSLGFRSVWINDTITRLSDDYLKNNQTTSQFLSASYYVKFDTRDYIEYPLTGIKLEAKLTEYGFGIFDNEKLNLMTLRAGVYLHKKLSDRWYLANAWITKLSFFDTPPYYLQRGLGYKDFVRGYEYYVVDGQDYGVVKFNVKFALVKRKEFHLKKLKWEKFNKPYFSLYLNGFTDAGYVRDDLYAQQNPFANRWILGYGLGLDLTAYYDFVMRVEYTLNIEGDGGVYIAFKKAF